MVKFKKRKRSMYENFNLYIYIYVPSFVLLIYFMLNSYYGFDLVAIKTLNSKLIDISLALSGTLLTILGLFLTLPNTKGRILLKRYGHDKILTTTLIVGIVSFLFTILLDALEIGTCIKYIIFIVGFVETIIASIWIYKMLEVIDD